MGHRYHRVRLKGKIERPKIFVAVIISQGTLVGLIMNTSDFIDSKEREAKKKIQVYALEMKMRDREVWPFFSFWEATEKSLIQF